MRKAFVIWLVLLSLGFSAKAGRAQDTVASRGYAQPHLLVEPAWLEAHQADADVRIVDMRDEKAYAAGHILGAVRVDEGALRNANERLTYLPRPEAFKAMMEKAGVTNFSHVIIYDDQGGKMAARLWYVMNAFGHSRISLVNGGWNKWIAEKRASSTEAPAVTPTPFAVKETPDMTCPLPQFLARKPNVVVLDARSPDEFIGKSVSPNAAKAGRVPGAVSVEWKENVAGPNLEFKSASDLRRLYVSKGVTPDKEVVVHCASGGRAAQSLFTLKLLGYPKVKVYYGSFTDYAALPNAPIEK